MASKLGIGYSPLTDKIYLGKQNKEKRIWVGDKTDITDEFLTVAFSYFEEGTIRDIVSDSGDSNLLINIKNDKDTIKKLIETLTKELHKKENV